MPQIPLIKGDRVDPTTDYRDALPVNMYAVSRPILGASGYMLCYPGLTRILGANQWTDPAASIGPGWTYSGNGVYYCDGSQVGNSGLVLPTALTAGDGEYCSVTINSISSGSIRIRCGSDFSDYFTTVGTHTATFAATTTTLAEILCDSTFVGTVSSISFKKASIGSGVDRAGVYNDRFTTQYRISGTDMIEVAADGTVNVLGSVSGADQARMEGFYSFNTQGVIADGKMFLYDPTGGFREVTDPDLGDPIDGVWVDGYYFMTDGETLFHTDINDEESIDPLKFATAEFMPDKSLGLAKTQDNKVMVFGRYTLEYFINAATANFAFQRVQTRAQKIGIVATHAKCESEGNWYITGGRKEDSVGVHAVGIGASQKVSTREVDKILKEYTEPELANMRMESRMEDNVYFVLVHLPNETLCLNTSIAKSQGIESAWTVVKTDIAGNVTYRAINGVFDARTANWTYGDKQDGTIGTLDESVFTHYDEAVEWLLYTPFLDLDGVSIDQIQLDTIPGRTTYDDATVAFSMTGDGETYGQEYFNMYGLPLDRGRRFYLRRLGYVRDWVGFKFRGATKSRMAFSMLDITYG